MLPLVKENIFGPLRRAGYEHNVYAHTGALSSITNPRNGEHDEPIDARSLERELPGSTVQYSSAEEADSLYGLEQLLVNGDPWCVACLRAWCDAAKCTQR